MPPTAPAAPVTRIGLSCLWFAVMSLTLGYVQKTQRIHIDQRMNLAGRPACVHTPGAAC
jgi:hypothetical protein